MEFYYVLYSYNVGWTDPIRRKSVAKVNKSVAKVNKSELSKMLADHDFYIHEIIEVYPEHAPAPDNDNWRNTWDKIKTKH